MKKTITFEQLRQIVSEGWFDRNKIRVKATLVATYPVEGGKRKLYKLIAKDDISLAAISRLSSRLIRMMNTDPDVQENMPDNCLEGASVDVFEGEKADIAKEFAKDEDRLAWLRSDVDKEAFKRHSVNEARGMEVELDIPSKRNMNGWTTGHAYLGDTEYEVQIKWFDEPSQFGIKGGRISKLWVAKTDGYDRNEVMCYDRGWDTKPKTPEDKEVLKAILKEFN